MFEKVKGSLVFALAFIDQGDLENAKSYIMGALQSLDDEVKPNLVKPRDGVQGHSGSSKNKRLKKG